MTPERVSFLFERRDKREKRREKEAFRRGGRLYFL